MVDLDMFAELGDPVFDHKGNCEFCDGRGLADAKKFSANVGWCRCPKCGGYGTLDRYPATRNTQQPDTEAQSNLGPAESEDEGCCRGDGSETAQSESRQAAVETQTKKVSRLKDKKQQIMSVIEEIEKYILKHNQIPALSYHPSLTSIVRDIATEYNKDSTSPPILTFATDISDPVAVQVLPAEEISTVKKAISHVRKKNLKTAIQKRKKGKK